MRHMSFMLTTRQVREGTKDVTRRVGWWFLRPGDVLWAVEKAQGLKKGERVTRIRRIRIISTRRERLDQMTQDPAYGVDEVRREGFAGEMTPSDFVAFFSSTMGCAPADDVNRIEFAYVTGAQA